MSEAELAGRAQSGLFFLEPSGPEPIFYSNTSAIEIVQSSQDDHHILARARLNSWLKAWDFGDLSELVPRLMSRFSSQHEGAVWELFINAMFRHLGFAVTRDPRRDEGNTPDFLMQGHGVTFFVEATCVPSGAKLAQEKNWLDLVSKIETLQRDDFYISLQPVQMSDETARSSYFCSKITGFLDGLDYEESAHWTVDDLPTKAIKFGNWEIEIRVLRRAQREEPSGIIGMRGVGSSGIIPDLDNLKVKIHEKRKRYYGLDHPYFIAILENSFFASDDVRHRFGALFGREAIRLYEDGSSEWFRHPDGVWDVVKGERNVEGLLLSSHLLIWAEEIELPEFWTNPNIPNGEVSSKLALSQFTLEGEMYVQTGSPRSWNGLC